MFFAPVRGPESSVYTRVRLFWLRNLCAGVGITRQQIIFKCGWKIKCHHFYFLLVQVVVARWTKGILEGSIQ